VLQFGYEIWFTCLNYRRLDTLSDTDTTKTSKITYEKTGGVFGIYRLQELSDDGRVIERLQNGEKLIWFESSSVRMFHDLHDRQSVFTKRSARENETSPLPKVFAGCYADRASIIFGYRGLLAKNL